MTLRLYLIHTRHVFSMSQTQYGAYIVAAKSNAQAQTALEESGRLTDDKPHSHEMIMRTEYLDNDDMNPLIAFIHYGNRTLDPNDI